MKKTIAFLHVLYDKVNENEILPLATQLTYRLIFSLFPFLIFLVSLVGFFDIDAEFLLHEVYRLFPLQIAQVVDNVIHEVVDTSRPAILSTSLLLSLFTVTTGLMAVMRGINRAYGFIDARKAYVRWLYCILLMFALAFAMIFSLLTIIFGDIIHAFLQHRLSIDAGLLTSLFGLVGFLIAILIMLVVIMLIYRLSCAHRQPFAALLPGALLTLFVWAISSSIFNFYINNFSRYSLVYGSIASIFITMLWLNIISVTILVGAQFNALIAARHSCN